MVKLETVYLGAKVVVSVDAVGDKPGKVSYSGDRLGVEALQDIIQSGYGFYGHHINVENAFPIDVAGALRAAELPIEVIEGEIVAPEPLPVGVVS